MGVKMDIRQPIKREKKVRKLGGECLMGEFKYEDLPTFCYTCGRIGHIDRHCEIRFRFPDQEIEQLWSAK
ncbi:hypothetical protein LINPERHAP1_LOCUS5077 [Linum perenne]